MKRSPLLFVILSVVLYTSSCKKENGTEAQLVVINASGDIVDEMDNFRQLLGPLNTTTGVTGGRREINWDGVPDSLVGRPLPGNFFNLTDPGSPPTRQRGLAYAASGEFRISNNSFAEVNSQAAGQFAPFSGNKSFTNINSNEWTISFEVPGQTASAAVKGFAAVFSDVDKANSTSLEFFNEGRSLGKFFVAARTGTSSFSFLGIYFKNNERITKVTVRHDGILSDGQKDISDSGIHDLVVLDDLLYSEPVAR